MAFVNTPVDAVVPPIGVLLIEPTWRLPEPVAFVKVMPVEEVSVVAMIVAAWKLFDPVALVKVRPVEDTVVPRSVVIVRFVPVEFVKVRPWRAETPAVTLIPALVMIVPVAEMEVRDVPALSLI